MQGKWSQHAGLPLPATTSTRHAAVRFVTNLPIGTLYLSVVVASTIVTNILIVRSEYKFTYPYTVNVIQLTVAFLFMTAVQRFLYVSAIWMRVPDFLLIAAHFQQTIHNGDKPPMDRHQNDRTRFYAVRGDDDHPAQVFDTYSIHVLSVVLCIIYTDVGIVLLRKQGLDRGIIGTDPIWHILVQCLVRIFGGFGILLLENRVSIGPHIRRVDCRLWHSTEKETRTSRYMVLSCAASQHRMRCSISYASGHWFFGRWYLYFQ